MAKETNGPRISFSDVLANSLFLRGPERIREVAAETAAARQADVDRLIHENKFVTGQIEGEVQRQAAYAAIAVAMKRVAQRRADENRAANEAFAMTQREVLPQIVGIPGEFENQSERLREFAGFSSKENPLVRSAVRAQGQRPSSELLWGEQGLHRRPNAGATAVPGTFGHVLRGLLEDSEGYGRVDFNNSHETSKPNFGRDLVGLTGTVQKEPGRVDVRDEGQPESGTWASDLRETLEALEGTPGVEKIVVGEPSEPGGVRPIEVYFRNSRAATGPTLGK